MFIGKLIRLPATTNLYPDVKRATSPSFPFENFESLDEILAAKSRPPTEEERERRGVSAKGWNLTAPSNVTT